MGRLDVLSLWPSFGLLVFFLVIFLECRTLGGRVTLPLGSFLMVFCYGSIGAPLLALLLQQIPLFPEGGADPLGPMAWLFGPPVEELAKALPVIVLAFLTRESRRLSIADLTLIGFASGAGFGFVEGNLNALVNGALPSLQHLAAFGLQTETGVIFFAGHPVSTALVGLAAGIGLRFMPPKFAYAWVPAAFVILWASFDHGIYNWKVLQAGDGDALPQAHFLVEILHLLTLHGQLQTWALLAGLIVAQFCEAYLCSKAVGARRDLLLAREWRPWVANEWLVALLRMRLGRAAFAQTLGYFRLRRAFYLATFEARRDPKDVTLSRHARSLEDRLKRERSMLFDPPPGTWLLPLPVLRSYAAQWTWRMRWVLIFVVLLLFLFLLDPAALPDWLRQFLFGQTFTIGVVVAGVAFATWRIVLFARQPPPDPLAAEGAACAGYYTRALLLGSALACGLFPSLAMLLGWKAFAPGAAFISGYLPGWIAQGGNLQTLLGLGTIGAAVAPDPRPAGEALHHEIAAADERMRRLGSDIEHAVGTGDATAPGPQPPIRLDAFLDAMAKLDAERDAQARRQLAYDECARQAGESTIRDPAPVVQAVKDEFDRLAGELLETAGKELDAIALLEQTYGRAWIEIIQDLDAHDTLRRRLKTPLRLAWQAQNDVGWALRVVEATDECLLPMQLTLLPELHALATTANSARADMVAAGVERIREAASQFGDADPFAFAVGTNQADEDEAALLAEFASSAPVEAPKPFGHRAPQPVETPIQTAVDDKIAPHIKPEAPAAAQLREPNYQEALDQLIDAPRSDQAYLDTIRHLELSEETLRHPIEPVAKPEVDDLINAIKRDSGYLAFKDPRAPQVEEDSGQPAPAESASEDDNASAPREARVSDDADDASEIHVPSVDEPVAAEPETALHPEKQFEPAEEQAREADDAHADHAEATPVVEEAAPAEAETLDEPEAHVEPQEHARDVTEVVEEAAPAEAETLLEPETHVEPQELAHEADDALADDSNAAPDVEEAAPAETETQPQPEAQGAPEENAREANAALADRADEIYAPSVDEAVAAEPETPLRPAEHVEPAEERALAADAAVADRADEIYGPSVDEADDETAAAAPAANTSEAHAATAEPEATRHKDTAEQEPVEDIVTPAETIEPAKAETPATVEAYAPTPAPQPTTPRDEEAPARTEPRASLFGRLFRTIRGQSGEAPAKPAHRDQWTKAEAPHAKKEQTPSVEERLDALVPAKTESEPEKTPDEIAAPTADWLADLASSENEDESAKLADTSLKSIDWPALSTPVTYSVSVPTFDAEPSIDLTAPVETPAGENSDQTTEPASLDAEPLAVEAEPAGEIETPSDDVVAEQPLDSAPAMDVAPLSDEPEAVVEDEDAAVPAPESAEFSSKADRLSYLLDKLESAMQAKAAREAAQPVTPEPVVAPVEPEPRADESALAAESEPAAPVVPIEQTLATEESEERLETAPAAVEPSDAPSVDAQQSSEPAEAEDAGEAQLKPDRLSFLLNKLFEAVKRESPAQTPKEHDATDDVEPAQMSQSAPDETPADDGILDLRLPGEASAEPAGSGEIDFGTVAAEPVETQPSSDIAAAEIVVPAPLPQAHSDDAATAIPHEPEPAAPQPVADASPGAPTVRPRPVEPVARFGSRKKPPRPAANVWDTLAQPVTPIELKPTALERAPESAKTEQPEQTVAPIELKATGLERSSDSAEAETPAAMPRRDWKLGSGPAPQGEGSKPAEAQADGAGAKKTETTFRLKTGSGALATVDAPPPGASAPAEKMQGKYYGPKHAAGDDDETNANSPSQQRALSLADALTEYYAKEGQPQPPMHTTDRATLQRIIANGKLEAPRRRGAPWSTSGMSRRGEVAIRLKPGAEQFVEFVPSTEIFGQVPHYYPRGVGKGSFATHIPAGHLEYFDLATRQWAPVQRG